MKTEAQIRRQYEQLRDSLDERARREWAGSEAIALGHGGIIKVHRAMGMATLDHWQGCARVTRQGGAGAGGGNTPSAPQWGWAQEEG